MSPSDFSKIQSPCNERENNGPGTQGTDENEIEVA